MSHSTLNRVLALAVFAISLGVYLITLAPTVVFWDVGEFIAAAKMMQVPHPPGSPFFLLVTRVAMMFPIAADMAVRAHALSAVFSALAVMFMYLVIVRTVMNFRGVPQTLMDGVTTYGASIIGALTLAFSTTFWGNSIEAEVYGASMFFLTAVLWLAMRWLDKSGETGNEKYLLLIAYLIGLSLGVHLLALLAIFPVLMLIFFRRYDITAANFVKFALVAVAVFVVVYPGIVKYLPGMMDGDFGGKKSQIMEYVPWLIILGVVYGAYATYKKRQKMAHIGLLAILLILLGYTTYVQVLIRANANPPMNENDPSNLARLTSYLGREQYGDAPLFMPRRYSQEPHQQEIYTKYTSDWDFLWRYQLNHMFNRYLAWNFIGAAGDEQDSGISFKDTWGIPFLLGLLGLYYQFRRDWKMGLVFLTAFIILGPILALYQNQQEPQPRERDYFYVGAFAVFALWITVGIVAIMEGLQSLLRNTQGKTYATVGAVVLVAAVIPGRLLQVNWHSHDRSGNYVAWDYSYNMLQTCEKDAILFTNGDNDTFPLWYLQDVEGVRRDVRIVNLSLVNTSWYIKQMKSKPYYAEASPVPISIPDRRIEELQPSLWEPRVIDLPVTDDALRRYGVTDTTIARAKKISFLMRHTLQFGDTKAIRIQDIMVRDIIVTNQWKRPIYFAVTCSPDSRIGLDEFLWFHGLAWRLEPRRINQEDLGVEPGIVAANIMQDPPAPSKTPQYGYFFRGLNDPSVYFDENVTRLMVNYRSAFMRLAMFHLNVDGNDSLGALALDRMEYLMPRGKLPLAWEIQSDIASMYFRFGRMDRYNEHANELEQMMNNLIQAGQVNMGSYYNPYRVLLDIYATRKEFRKELDLLRQLQVQFPNDPGLRQRIETAQAQLNLISSGQDSVR
jgi:hypothetical protein